MHDKIRHMSGSDSNFPRLYRIPRYEHITSARVSVPCLTCTDPPPPSPRAVFRAFRSQNLNLSISIETRPRLAAGGGTLQPAVVPTMLLYGSTLRWFENLQFILSGMTRPTRRGAVFNNVRPRKVQLSRHYKCVRLSLNLHAFQVSLRNYRTVYDDLERSLFVCVVCCFVDMVIQYVYSLWI